MSGRSKSLRLTTFRRFAEAAGVSCTGKDRPVVCVQGLGYVGTAMALAIAIACNKKGEPYFNVIGLDLPTEEGCRKISAINKGKLPFKCNDRKLSDALKVAHKRGNLIATPDPGCLSIASVVVVDVHLDVVFRGSRPSIEFRGFKEAIRTVGRHISAKCLVLIETTVPPGTCERVVAPLLNREMKRRGLPEGSFLLAHSYERVMPGEQYLDSIINFWRVYAGHTEEAAEACEEFLSKVINVKEFPLTRLHSTTASELAKVLENSYRATNIAFMEEWGRFAEAIGVDIFQVVDAIRMRPTHSNIRTPGFGVGGYCLTKDPLLGLISAREIFHLRDIKFPFSTMAIRTNRAIPLVSVEKIRNALGTLKRRRILLLGVSYLQDVGDTRNSPSQIFVEEVRGEGAEVVCHDPLVSYWEEIGEDVLNDIPSPEGFDVVVFAVPHREYRRLDIKQWIGDYRPLVLDAFNILSERQREDFKEAGCRVISIGRGEGG